MKSVAVKSLLGCALLLALFALAAPVDGVAYGKSARLSKNQMERNRAYRDKLYSRIKQLTSNQKQLGQVLLGIDQQIDSKEDEIKKTQDELNVASQEQSKLETECNELKSRLNMAQAKLGERARKLYMQNDMLYVDVLFQSASLSDFIDRVIYLQAIYRHDKQLIEDARQRGDAVRIQVAQLEMKIAAIKEVEQRLRIQQKELEETRSDKKLDMDAISNDKALAQRQIEELEAENKRIAAQLRAIRSSGGGYTGKAWSGSFKKPCAGTITSGYGMRFHPILHYNRMHTGVDISAAGGTTITAAGDGKVVCADWKGGYGKCVIVDHGNGRSTLYGHMSRITCRVGDIVNTSTKIGEVGSTGMSTGNHLHFEVRINGDPVDPMKSLD